MKNLIITVQNQNSLELQSITKCRSITVYEGVIVTLPVCAQTGYIDVRTNATLTLPVCAQTGNIDVGENATLTLPVCAQTGNIDVRTNATLKAPFTDNLDAHSIDNTLFVCTYKRISKGVTMMKGYVITSVTKGIPNKKPCHVAQKDGFSAHGDTLKKAVEDLTFKVLSEKMKSEPLSMSDTVDVPRYRAITGACSTGVQMFRDAHGLKKDSYTVEELLPILEKNNAYGIQRFKQLIKN